jgi:integrase
MRVYRRPETQILWIEFKNPNGQKIRRSSGTSNQKEAEAFLKLEVERSKSITFQAAVENFFLIKERTLRESSIDTYRWSLRATSPIFGDLMLMEITPDKLKEFIRARRATNVTDTTVKRDLAFISSVFSCAMETMNTPPVPNPVITLPKRGLKDVCRLRWLRPTEYESLLRACTQDMHRLIIKTAVHTGMRHGELASLRKHHFDFPRREVILEGDKVKNGKERVVPLCAWLADELETMCQNTPRDYVFCHQDPLTLTWTPYPEFKRFWDSARVRSGVKNVRFHDLRHTFASWWVQSGGSLMVLRDILGHSSLQMVERYAHLNTEAKHREIRRIFAHTVDTVTPPPSAKSLI